MTGSPPTTAASGRAPSVLVVLIARDAAGWLRECLTALAAQTYPRMGVIAVDDASVDESREILTTALGEQRVIGLSERLGLAGALDAALERSVAAEADYILLVHDDASLDPDVVTRLIETAVGIGVERVGVVGAKIVDWDEPRMLRDVGRSADRFGHPYTPLQSGEIDQGQFDRVLEVLCVSSSAMLIARDAWKRAGGFDERLDSEHVDLDFCWRVRLAGFRVLMTPLARVLHRAATSAGERGPRVRHKSPRYEEDRAALAAMLKNYGPLNLLWLLPLALLLGLVRLLMLVLGRRFEEAYDLLSAWGWNLAHLPGTLSRRRKIQKQRRTKDRALRRFLESAGLRIPRWFQTAERIFEEQREIEEDDEGQPVARRLRDRTASLVGTHPVIVASFLGVVIGAVAIRGLLGPEVIAGGVLPRFPSTPAGFFGELVSGYRTTGLGGSLLASPALGVFGGLSALLFGSTALAQKVFLAGVPALATVLAYRAFVRLTGRPGPSVVAAASYGLSALTLWAFSEGRLSLLMTLAVLPPIVERLEVAFGPDEPGDGRWRFAAGLGVTLAVGVAFDPGVALASLVVVVIQAVGGSARGRGLLLAGASMLAGAVLLFPFVPVLAADRGAAFRSLVGTTDVSSLVRLTFGGGPGTWEIAAFLPIAALIAFALTGAGYRARSIRAVMTGLAGLALSWLAAAGYLPTALSNPTAYGALAAVSMAMMVAYGLSSVLTGIGRESFGLRQVGTALLTVVLGAGIALQVAAAMIGGWAVGGLDKIPPSFAVISSGARGDYRVLWVGSDDGDPFPTPGGDPTGVAPAGEESLRYALTGRGGVTALDTGRPLAGSGDDALRAALNEILAGTTSHGGALLAPFGVRFVVAPLGQIPAGAQAHLESQLDLDRIPASDLVIFRNAAGLPPAAAFGSADLADLVASGRPVDVARIGDAVVRPLKTVEGGWEGVAAGGPVVISTEFDGAWELDGGDTPPERSFGWSTSFREPTEGPVVVRYGAQLPRTIAIVLLAVVWAAALWITRKPVAR
jgi:GT2 family glycosyltransferase